MNERKAISICALASLFAFAAGARAGTINFDGIGTSTHVTGAGLDAFLATYGVSVSGGSGASAVDVINNASFYGGGALSTAPDTNFFMQQSGDSGQTFTLDFSTPLENVTFTRPELLAGPNGIVAAAWSETAYNGMNAEVGSLSGGMIASYLDVPAQTYTITGADITSVAFWSDGYGTAGIEGIPMTDLRLTAAVPEPPTPLLFGLGLMAMAGWALRRSKA